MKLVRGDKLSPSTRAEVLRGYLYRLTNFELLYEQAANYARNVQAERDRLSALNAELVQALEPFVAIFKQDNPPDAEYYLKHNSDHAWGFNAWILRWSDLIKARAALAKAKP